jgi:hypothetical protein
MSELSRYARQIVLPEVGVAGQRILRDSSALILGVGALGSAASLYLTAAGLGRLRLVDRDRVELSNLQRQVLYRQADVGRAKLAAAAAALTALNPDCAIETLPGPLSQEALVRAVSEADIALDCSDNFPTRQALNAACVAACGAALRRPARVVRSRARRRLLRLPVSRHRRGDGTLRGRRHPRSSGRQHRRDASAARAQKAAGPGRGRRPLVGVGRLAHELAQRGGGARSGLRGVRSQAVTASAEVLTLPRRLAIGLLHQAQSRAGAPLLGVVVGARRPQSFLPVDAHADLAAAIVRLRRNGQHPWAVFVYRPQLSQAPTAADFAVEPALPRLTASLATKGVLQLRAWTCEAGRVRECELHIEE